MFNKDKDFKNNTSNRHPYYAKQIQCLKIVNINDKKLVVIN